MKEKQDLSPIYITTPIYYVNSEPHIGGVYTTLMADILNRFHKLNGRSTRFLTGTDEHGQKIQQSAEARTMAEQEFVDIMAQKFRAMADYMDFKYDDFIRTTEPRHRIFVQHIWRKLVENDWIYKGKYSGWYCVSDEAYYSEDELLKNGDGSYETSLGKKVEWREEESYFFRLGEFQKILLDICSTTDFIQPSHRNNEIIAFLRDNSLRDLSISRNTFSWGIKIPCDANGKELISSTDEWLDGIEPEEKHVIYVWLDALFNYQSALDSVGKLEEFWNSAKVIHLVGKDILRFHSVYWPAFLMAIKFKKGELKKLTVADILKKNIIPHRVFAHGWWTNEGRKISKSLGNAIETYAEIRWLRDDFNIREEIAKDYLKYYLATEMRFGNDGDYSRSALVDRINAELVNNVGNLMQRVLAMFYKNFDGELGVLELDTNIELEEILTNKTLNNFDFLTYRDLILDLATEANGYMEQQAPWNLKKLGKIGELRDCLMVELVYIVKIVILLQPLCPCVAEELLNYLNINPQRRNFITLYTKNTLNLAKIGEPKPFFPRLMK